MPQAIAPSLFSPFDGMAEPGSVLVEFADDAAPAGFDDTPPSSWALAAEEAAFEGEAIDTLREDSGKGLLPVLAAATFVVAEADPFAAAGEATIAAATVPTDATADGPDRMAAPVAGALYLQPETSLQTHDIAGYGIDWTDTLLG